MEVYQFVPSKTLTDLNTRLDEAGSELHLELDFGDDGNAEDDDENPAAVMARIAPDLDLANVGQEFDPFDVDRQRPKKAHQVTCVLVDVGAKQRTQFMAGPHPAVPSESMWAVPCRACRRGQCAVGAVGALLGSAAVAQLATGNLFAPPPSPAPPSGQFRSSVSRTRAMADGGSPMGSPAPHQQGRKEFCCSPLTYFPAMFRRAAPQQMACRATALPRRRPPRRPRAPPTPTPTRRSAPSTSSSWRCCASSTPRRLQHWGRRSSPRPSPSSSESPFTVNAAILITALGFPVSVRFFNGQSCERAVRVPA